MIHGAQLEVWLAAAYAGLLTLIALCLQAVARHAHRRSRHYELAGFRYHARLDLWECPAGQSLTRVHTDWERQIALYRAQAQVCNGCPLKSRCTDSDRGREIAHHHDSWITSEVCRFQRGISLVLLFLAALILVLEIARHDSLSSTVLLVAVLLPVGAFGLRTAARLRSR